ncbi:hypothetical protein BC826DRAFT_1066369, partial [Russula brevipes]
NRARCPSPPPTTVRRATTPAHPATPHTHLLQTGPQRRTHLSLATARRPTTPGHINASTPPPPCILAHCRTFPSPVPCIPSPVTCCSPPPLACNREVRQRA